MKKLQLLLFATTAFVNAYAQKLPKIQTISVRAPQNIKIDGKTTEWNDQFEAYNVNNVIYYTISNDAANLYLTVRANNGYANEKAIFGITFTLNLPKENGALKQNVSIIFPTRIEVPQSELVRHIVRKIRSIENIAKNDSQKERDSLRLVVNKKIGEVFKEIGVVGLKDIAEPKIPIYNTENIQTAAQFNEKFLYTYELALPLKYLGNSVNAGKKFNYNIKLNGLQSSAGKFGIPIVIPDGADFLAADDAYVMFPTDFSGEYSLAK